jgi:putative transposase
MCLKKILKPAQLLVLARELLTNYRVPVRRACRVVLLHRTTRYYERKEKNDQLLCARMREITQTRVPYGMWRIFTLLRREG